MTRYGTEVLVVCNCRWVLAGLWATQGQKVLLYHGVDLPGSRWRLIAVYLQSFRVNEMPPSCTSRRKEVKTR